MENSCAICGVTSLGSSFGRRCTSLLDSADDGEEEGIGLPGRAASCGMLVSARLVKAGLMDL